MSDTGWLKCDLCGQGTCKAFNRCIKDPQVKMHQVWVHQRGDRFVVESINLRVDAIGLKDLASTNTRVASLKGLTTFYTLEGEEGFPHTTACCGVVLTGPDDLCRCEAVEE